MIPIYRSAAAACYSEDCDSSSKHNILNLFNLLLFKHFSDCRLYVFVDDGTHQYYDNWFDKVGVERYSSVFLHELVILGIPVCWLFLLGNWVGGKHDLSCVSTTNWLLLDKKRAAGDILYRFERYSNIV